MIKLATIALCLGIAAAAYSDIADETDGTVPAWAPATMLLLKGGKPTISTAAKWTTSLTDNYFESSRRTVVSKCLKDANGAWFNYVGADNKGMLEMSSGHNDGPSGCEWNKYDGYWVFYGSWMTGGKCTSSGDYEYPNCKDAADVRKCVLETCLKWCSSDEGSHFCTGCVLSGSHAYAKSRRSGTTGSYGYTCYEEDNKTCPGNALNKMYWTRATDGADCGSDFCKAPATGRCGATEATDIPTKAPTGAPTAATVALGKAQALSAHGDLLNSDPVSALPKYQHALAAFTTVLGVNDLITQGMAQRVSKVAVTNGGSPLSGLNANYPADAVAHQGSCPTAVPAFVNGVKGAKVVGKGPHGNHNENQSGSIVPIDCADGFTANPEGSNPLVFIRCEPNAVGDAYTWVTRGSCNPTSTPEPTPAVDTNRHAIAQGDQHGIAIKSDGTAVEWGEPTRAIAVASAINPPSISIDELRTLPLHSVAVGGEGTCAIRKDDKTLVCWGSSRRDHGQVMGPAISNGAGQFPLGEAVRDVSCAGYYCCVIKESDGKAMCWGYKNMGYAEIYSKIPADELTTIQTISSYGYVCGLKKSDGKAVCWGNFGAYGGLTGMFKGYVVPSNVAFSSLSEACGIKLSDSKPYCWAVAGEVPDVKLSSIGSRPNYWYGGWACGIQQSDSRLVCWGSDKGDTRPAVPVKGKVDLAPKFAIEAGSFAIGDAAGCAAKKSDDTLVCWGQSNHWRYINSASETLVTGSHPPRVPSSVVNELAIDA